MTQESAKGGGVPAYQLSLSPRELSYTILAVQRYRKARLENEDEDDVDDLGDLMILDAALKKLNAARDQAKG